MSAAPPRVRAASASRPQSTMASEAMSMAAEAMRHATEAMTRASELLYRSEMGIRPGSPDWLRPISNITGLTFVSGRESQIANNDDAAPSNNPKMEPRNNSQEAPRPESKAVSHVDLMDAVSKLRQSQENSSAHPSTIRTSRYGEDVADRNIGGLYPDSPPEQFEPHLIPRPETPRSNGLGISTPHEIMLVATICMAHFLTQAGLAQVIAPLHYIGASFSASSPSLSWYPAAFSLTVGTFILPSGRLGDVFGHKKLFVIGWVWYSLFSLLAGFSDMIQKTGAQGEVFFIFCRAMQGIGPALLMPNALAILGRTYPPGNKKNMLFALFGASAPAGFVIGAAMASVFAQKAHWKWGFWAMAITCFFMAVLAILIIPPPQPHEEHTLVSDSSSHSGNGTRLPLWARLDLPGTALGVTALLLINVALNEAPLVSWSTPYTYFILIIGVLILLAFLFCEFHPSLSPQPLIPTAALSLDTCFVLVCTAAGWATFGIWVFFLWDFLETVRMSTPLSVSAQFAPAPIFGFVASAFTGFLLSKTTPQVIMLLSMLAFFTGTVIVATAPVAQIYWKQVFFSIVIMPFGMDLSFPSATILLSNKVGHEHQGVAASLVNTVVNYSISIGLGLAGTVQRAASKNVNGEPTDILGGIRGAWYLGMGLSGVGIAVAVVFVVVGGARNRRTGGGGGDEKANGHA